jgi:hypothetical protein
VEYKRAEMLEERSFWEVFWKRNQFKKGLSGGGVDNIRYLQSNRTVLDSVLDIDLFANP